MLPCDKVCLRFYMLKILKKKFNLLSKTFRASDDKKVQLLVYTKACSIKNQHNLKRDFNYTQVPQQGSACLHHRNSTYCSVVFMTFNFMWLIFMWVCFWRCCLFCFLVDKLGGGNLLKPLFTNLSKYGLEGDLYPPLLPRENNYLLTEHFL